MIIKSKHHLNSVNENYLEHMLIAFKVSYGALLAIIHGLIGVLFENRASNKIKKLYEFINKKS